MPTYYLSDADLVSLQYEKLDPSAPSTLDEAQGWTVDKKASPNYCCYKPDTQRPAGDFLTIEPSSFSQLGYRTVSPLNGSFDSGDWVLSFKVKCDNYYAQTGYVKFRLWRSANADGSGATQITPGWQASSLISFTAAYQYRTGTITWAAGSSATLTTEYLFLEIEWSCQASGGNNAADVFWVHNEGAAEKLDTPAWTPGSQTISGAGNIGSGEVHGTLKIILFILAAALASAEAAGSPWVNQSLSAASISSEEAPGAPQVNLTLLALGLDSAEAWGNPQVMESQVVQPGGGASGEGWGIPALSPQSYLLPPGLDTAESFGGPVLLPESLTLEPSGIPGGEVLGSPQVYSGAVLLPEGISAGETLGLPLVQPGPVALGPAGLGSQEALGLPVIFSSIPDPLRIEATLREAEVPVSLSPAPQTGVFLCPANVEVHLDG